LYTYETGLEHWCQKRTILVKSINNLQQLVFLHLYLLCNL